MEKIKKIKMFKEKIILKIFLVIFLLTISGKITTAEVNQNPVGWLDAVDQNSFRGWVCDPDDYSASLTIHFYVDGNPATGIFLGSTIANQEREKEVGDICGGKRSHGFTFNTPDSIRDGKTHTIHAYAINTPIGPNLDIPNSPKNIILPSNFVDGKYFKIADFAKLHSYGYGYAPSIIKKDGKYHVFFCSTGDGRVWDYIRYSNSTDGKNWSEPIIKLKPSVSLGETDFCACDPNVVFFEGYYYMYYGGLQKNGLGGLQGFIHISRSQNIEGPYLTYTERGTWEDTPSDPKGIIKPFLEKGNAKMVQSDYGAGQPIVIVKNGKLLMWYTDTSIDPNGEYMLESNNPVAWTPDQSKNINLIDVHYSDIKYDSVRDGFVMISIMGLPGWMSSQSYLVAGFSSDGLHWGERRTVIPAESFPDYSHNPGLSGDEYGNLIPGKSILAFAAPFNFGSNNIQGYWDLYGTEIDIGQISFCVPNWQTGSWGTCTNSQQTRTVTDLNNCGITTNKPATTQSCIMPCTPNWSCSSWSTCSNSQQTRTCTDSNICGVTTDKPTTTQSCTSICTPNWQCSSWNNCSNSQQTRSCTDLSNCGITTSKPAVTQSCTVACVLNCTNKQCGSDGCGGTCGSCSSNQTCNTNEQCVNLSTPSPSPSPTPTPSPNIPITQMTRTQLITEVTRITNLIAQLQTQLAQLNNQTPTTSQSFTTNLYYGMMNNPEVKRLQQFLINNGYMSKGYDSGNYSIYTVNALKYYQRLKGITPISGYFGLKTRGAINIEMGVK